MGPSPLPLQSAGEGKDAASLDPARTSSLGRRDPVRGHFIGEVELLLLDADEGDRLLRYAAAGLVGDRAGDSLVALGGGERVADLARLGGTGPADGVGDE